jgi:hypothetical protein
MVSRASRFPDYSINIKKIDLGLLLLLVASEKKPHGRMPTKVSNFFKTIFLFCGVILGEIWGGGGVIWGVMPKVNLKTHLKKNHSHA